MRNLKLTILTSLFFCGLFYCNPLLSQDSYIKSSWTAGVNLGINLEVKCEICDKDYSTTSIFATNAFVHYRLKRWLGISASTSYYQQDTYTNGAIYDTGTNVNRMVQKDFRINVTSFSLGPQLLFRLGQGDLGLEFRYGVANSAARVHALTNEGQSFDIKYKPELLPFSSYKIDYTYWPKSRFGITLGLETTFVDNGFRNSRVISSPLAELYPNEDPEVLAQLSPFISGLDLVNLTIGVAYRFK